MKPNPIFSLVIILALASLACSINIDAPQIEFGAGPTRTMEINEAAPEAPAKLVIGMGAGKLNITSGGSNFVTGSIRYNVDAFEPKVRRDGSELRIEQERTSLPAGIGEDRINDWQLRLGDTPVDLTIEAGAYEGDVNLTGVPLTRLQVNDGAGSNTVTFNLRNPERMEELVYNTGASQVELNGLANANFERMRFSGGAGDFTLDFSGELQSDARVEISGGAASFKIIVPDGTRARITVEGGLNNINPTGTWTVNGAVYETEGSGPLLDIVIDMGIGNLDLVAE